MSNYLRRLEGIPPDEHSAVQPHDFAELVHGHRKFKADILAHADATDRDKRRYRKVIKRHGEETADAINILLRLWYHSGEDEDFN